MNRAINVTPEVEKRFWRFVSRRGDDDCWEWQGALMEGYGSFTIDGESFGAHRVSYTIHHGHIPAGLSVLHSCHNRRCANPHHLRAGTQAENVQDMLDAGRHKPPAPEDVSPLDEGEVVEMRNLYSTGKYTQTDLANKYRVSINTVSLILLGERWIQAGGPTFNRLHKEKVTRYHRQKEMTEERPQAGQLNYNAKLTIEQVTEIKRQYKPIYGMKVKLAKQYGVSPTAIADIISGKRWGHVRA